MIESIRRDDYGFFGPDSPSWKVWASPTALIGFQRAVVLEHFDPFLAAAVADSAGIYTDPSGRLDRTLAYFLTVAVADGRTAIQVSDALMRIHARAKGIDHRIALQRQQSGRAAVDPHHRLAFGAQVLRAVRAGTAVAGGGVAVLGGVAHRRRTADLQALRRSHLTRRG
jgi:hypothetical protein